MAKQKKKFVPVKDRNKDPIYTGANGKKYWKLYSPNGNQIGMSAQGQGFNSRAAAKKNMKALHKVLTKYLNG